MGSIRYLRRNPTNPDQPRSDTIYDPSQTKRTVQIIKDAQIYERVEERYAKAIETFGVDCHLYRRLFQGRPCSCVDRSGIPSDRCPVCYAVGIVGGYEQYGHTKYTLDSTAPFSDLDGVEVWDDEEYADIRPTPIVLEKDARGVLTGERVYINSALAYDGYKLYGIYPSEYGGELIPYFLDTSTGTWKNLSMFGDFLLGLGKPPWTLETQFRVEFKNYSPNGDVPLYFQGLHVKWKTGKDILKVEQAQFSEIAKKLTDLGFVTSISSMKFTVNPRPKILDTDLIVKINSGERYKVTAVNRGDPGDRALWQDLSIRPVQEHEILSEVF
jgi:hypothetical protein